MIRRPFTKKQTEIMLLIERGSINESTGAREAIDLDQLIERLSYEVTKDSMHFSIRALRNHGLIDKTYQLRRGRRHVCYDLTALGWSTMKGRGDEETALADGLGETMRYVAPEPTVDLTGPIELTDDERDALLRSLDMPE